MFKIKLKSTAVLIGAVLLLSLSVTSASAIYLNPQGSANGVVKLSSSSLGGMQTVTTTAKVASDGVVHRETVIKSLSNGVSIHIPADTKVIDKKGHVYTGTITTAKIVVEADLPKALPSTLRPQRMFYVATEGGVEFSKNVKVTIPLTGIANTKDAQVWYYDATTETYQVAGDGGVLSADGKSVVVTLNHFTYFVIGGGENIAVAGFADIANHWAKNYITELVADGVVVGKTATAYQPNVYLTRAEATKIALLSIGYQVQAGAVSFPDTKYHWASDILGTAKKFGVVSGYEDGSFKPNSYITRAEVLTLLFNAKGIATDSASAKAGFPDVQQNLWYSPAINFAVEKGIVSGYEDGTFGPSNYVTRGEMAKLAILVKALK